MRCMRTCQDTRGKESLEKKKKKKNESTKKRRKNQEVRYLDFVNETEDKVLWIEHEKR